MANDIPIAPFNPLSEIVNASFSFIPYPNCDSCFLNNNIDINLEIKTVKYTKNIFANYLRFMISYRKSTFTPTSTPAIKNIFVSAINTAYDQKLSMHEAVSPIK